MTVGGTLRAQPARMFRAAGSYAHLHCHVLSGVQFELEAPSDANELISTDVNQRPVKGCNAYLQPGNTAQPICWEEEVPVV